MVLRASLERTASNTINLKESKFKSCLKNIYNTDKNELLNRNATNWGRILCYYTVFFTIIFGVFFCFLSFILHAIEQGHFPLFNKHSLRSQDISFIDISIFPMMNSLTPLIEIDGPSYLKYSYIIQDKLEKYKFEGVQKCDEPHVKSTPFNGSQTISYKVKRDSEYVFKRMSSNRFTEPPCWFNTSTLGPCSVFPYGFDVGKPCIYLKINKALNWVPNPYLKDSSLPENMSADMESNIRNSLVPKMWASCKPTASEFQDYIGPLSYYPGQNFEIYYFPYSRNNKYQSPLIAMQINEIKKANTKISLTCKLWVKEDFTSDRTFNILLKTSQKKIDFIHSWGYIENLDYDIYVDKSPNIMNN